MADGDVSTTYEPTDDPSGKAPRDEKALQSVLAEIGAQRIRLYRNIMGHPYVSCDVPEFPAVHLPLFNPDFEAWLTTFNYERNHFLLRKRETERILQELSGRSLRERLANVTDPAILRFIESEPLVAIILEFMHTRHRHESRAEALWKDLKAFGQGRRLLVRGRKHFPGGANVLSRQLPHFKDILALLGISCDIERSNGCTITLTRRLDDSTPGPSTQPSPSNPPGEKDLPSKDDRNDRLARLRAKQSQPTQPEERNEK